MPNALCTGSATISNKAIIDRGSVFLSFSFLTWKKVVDKFVLSLCLQIELSSDNFLRFVRCFLFLPLVLEI